MRKARSLGGLVVLGLVWGGCTKPGAKHDDHDMPGAVSPSDQGRVGAEAQVRRFPGGFPAKEDTARARDEQDIQRAVTAYRFWYPTVSGHALVEAPGKVGVRDNEGFFILAGKPHHVGFTLNSDTPYGSGVVDLSREPMVVELPQGAFVALAIDHHQRWIMDMGLPGPDAGKGGKHLILPPGYKGDIPSGFHVGRSSSKRAIVALRALPLNGNLDEAMKALGQVKLYPLSSAASPKLAKVVDITNTKLDTTSLAWEDNIKYWQALKTVIDAEPVVDEFRPMYGLLSAIGIEKGRPFAPDARMKGILERAAQMGRDQMLVADFDSARPDRMTWPDRKWEWAGLVPGNGNFETQNGLDVEARDRWFAQAIGASPAMFRREMGAGSLYWLALRDKNGSYLDGGKSYKMTVPLPVPGKLFWSVTVYDAITRSEVRASQDNAALRSLFELKDLTGTSVDLHFGPRAPAGQEGRFIQTVPGRGWFAYFRIYGPDQAAFDGTWKPGDPEVEM